MGMKGGGASGSTAASLRPAATGFIVGLVVMLFLFSVLAPSAGQVTVVPTVVQDSEPLAAPPAPLPSGAPSNGGVMAVLDASAGSADAAVEDGLRGGQQSAPQPAGGIADDLSLGDGGGGSGLSAAEFEAIARGEGVNPGPRDGQPLSAAEALADELVAKANESGVLRSHEQFSQLRRAVARRLALARAVEVLSGPKSPSGSGATTNSADSGTTGTVARTDGGVDCVEFLRLHESDGDTIYRVPCVPRNASGLNTVRLAPFGVIATFDHRAYAAGVDSAAAATDTGEDGESTTVPPTTSDSPTKALTRGGGGAPLRVAVEMSGHMRTYKRCAASTKERLLDPTGALLFLATYPDLGDKRFGVRVQEQDNQVDLGELRDLYGADHLAAMYLVDLPTARVRLMQGFPTLFVQKQWSWMIYQLFMMELAHNVTTAHVGLSTFHESFGGQPYAERVDVFSGEKAAETWGGFDVYIRVRPDLFILGTIRLQRSPELPQQTIVYHFECEGSDGPYAPFAINESDILRSPHHPIFLWPYDPLSDHSAIGQPAAMHSFLRLFSDTVFREPAEQQRRVFYHGQTAERLWGEHADRQRLAIKRVPGWHLMLRNAAKFTNATLHASAFKSRLIATIFGATEPNVGCPLSNNCIRVLTHKPKKKLGGGRKHSVKAGFTGFDCAPQ